MAKLSQHLRIECPKTTYFITSRTMLSRLWFVNNKKLDNAILGYLAKYQQKYEVTIYAFIIMGNHYHLIAKFPKGNKALFMQSFNSAIQNVTRFNVPRFIGGKLWARRYSAEALPNNQDISHWAFYAWLNPVAAGLCKKITKHLQYNSFFDSSNLEEKSYPVFKASQYQNRVRYNKDVKRNEFIEYYTLKFSKLPEFRDLSKEEYKSKLFSILYLKTKELCEKREKENKGFACVKKLKQQKAGLFPKRTKTSNRFSKRPLVLTLCKITRDSWLNNYFNILGNYLEASKKYREYKNNYNFPVNTYLPRLCVA